MKINNLNMIANHLFDNPGARYSDITKMLCKQKLKPWHRGMYSRYFSIWQRWSVMKPVNPKAPGNRQYAHRLWEKTPCGGWMLTLQGMTYVRK